MMMPVALPAAIQFIFHKGGPISQAHDKRLSRLRLTTTTNMYNNGNVTIMINAKKPVSKDYGMICLRPRGKDWPRRLKAAGEALGKSRSGIINDLIEANLSELEAKAGIRK